MAAASGISETELVANIWDWDPAWHVIWYADGERRIALVRDLIATQEALAAAENELLRAQLQGGRAAEEARSQLDVLRGTYEALIAQSEALGVETGNLTLSLQLLEEQADLIADALERAYFRQIFAEPFNEAVIAQLLSR